MALVLNLRTGLTSPQYHVVFDEEFTTVPYLTSDTAPPNWPHLVNKSSESVLQQQDNVSQQWLHPETIITAPEGAMNAAPEGATTVASEGATIAASEGADHTWTRGSDCRNTPFVDLNTLGLRRSERIAKNPRRTPYGLLVLALSAFSNSVEYSGSVVSSCFQSRVIAYEDYLATNFDGTANNMSPLAQIYQTSKINNEVFNLREMLQQDDKEEFVKAMESEVAAIFKEKIWELVPKKEMVEHYKREREKGKVIKREQLMMIWSFKRKRKPDGTLSKLSLIHI